MDVFDKDEGVPDWVAQDEEERAAEGFREMAGPPSFRALLPEVKTRTLLVMMCPSSHLLLHHACKKKQVIGSLLCTSISMRGNQYEPHHRDQTCFVYAIGDPSECLVVVCQARLGIVETNFLPQVLLEKVSPGRVVVLDSIVGPGITNRCRDQEIVPSMFCLRTRAMKESVIQVGESIPTLPSGILIEGLTASLMAHCEATSLEGIALVYNQPLPIPDYRQILQWSEVLAAFCLPGLTTVPFKPTDVKAEIQGDLELLWDQSAFGKVYQ